MTTLIPVLGFEAMGLHVLEAEPMSEQQAVLTASGDGPAPGGLATLIDRLEQRLGRGSVLKLSPRQSHIPERAVVRSAASDGPALRFDAGQLSSSPGHCSCSSDRRKPASWPSSPKARLGNSAGAAWCIRSSAPRAPSASLPEWWRRGRRCGSRTRLLRRRG